MKKIEEEITEEQKKKWFKAVRNNDIKTVKRMLKEGFDVNAHGENGWTALHYACYWEYFDIAKLLIDNEADVNIQNKYLRTPLHLTCYLGYFDTVIFLIDSGADITVRDIDGDTPLDKLKRDKQQYEELIQWLAENHPEKLLEYMASEKIQGNGIGL